MAMNLGYMELGGDGVVARVYYDTAWLDADPERDPGGAPLVDGPRGFCLDLTNPTGKVVRLVVYGLTGDPQQAQTIQIGRGDPVTTGPASGRSRTAAQMAALGFTTRGNVGMVTIGE